MVVFKGFLLLVWTEAQFSYNSFPLRLSKAVVSIRSSVCTGGSLEDPPGQKFKCNITSPPLKFLWIEVHFVLLRISMFLLVVPLKTLLDRSPGLFRCNGAFCNRTQSNKEYAWVIITINGTQPDT